jgi:hypothetical protein
LSDSRVVVKGVAEVLGLLRLQVVKSPQVEVVERLRGPEAVVEVVQIEVMDRNGRGDERQTIRREGSDGV